jgi:hypothetical protein
MRLPFEGWHESSDKVPYGNVCSDRNRSLLKSGPAIVFDDLCALAQDDWCPRASAYMQLGGLPSRLKVLDASQMMHASTRPRSTSSIVLRSAKRVYRYWSW